MYNLKFTLEAGKDFRFPRIGRALCRKGDKSLRIWIVHQHAIPPTKMGPTRHFDLAKALIAQGYEVLIIAGNYCHNDFHFFADPYQKTNKIEYYDSVPFIWFKAPAYKRNNLKRLINMIVFSYNLLSCRKLNKLARPDIIIGSSPSPFAAWAAARIAKRYQIPFIYEIRDLWPETLLALGKFRRYHPLVILLRAMERHLLTNSSQIISVLPGIKDYVTARNCPSRKVIWLPNCCDIAATSYQPPREKDVLKVIYAGSYNVSNDLETLLSAAKILEQRHPNKFDIQLIGQGPLKKNLQHYIRQEGLRNVSILSTVAKNQIHRVLAEADILVGMVKKSSLYRWGTSLNKITDYLAVGRPIVFALESPYSPIADAQAGLTVEPENPYDLAQALYSIACLPMAQRVQLGLNGRAYANQHYNLETMVSRLVEHLGNARIHN